MSALDDDRLDLHRAELPPEEITKARHEAEKTLGRKISPFPKEIAAYKKAGLKPPSE